MAQIPARDLALLTAKLVQWYHLHKRPLIFRDLTDPYQILVSEIMLQQTTVATAKAYFLRFIERFPNVATLASATEDEVVAKWAGLGYYRRARLLHAAAKVIQDTYGGRLPNNVQSLQSLPGIGRYTAGAIASFGFNMSAPIVEANTLRVYSRLFGITQSTAAAATQKQIWAAAEAMVQATPSPRDFNHAIMEYGALICQPAPQCRLCVISASCFAFQHNMTTRIPVLPAKQEKRHVTYAGFILRAADQYLIRRIPAGEWHAGLYQFPSFERGPSNTPQNIIHEKLGLSLSGLIPWADFRYVVTTNKVTLKVYRATLTSKPVLDDPALSWKTLEQIAALPLGSAQKKVLNLLISQDDLLAETI